MENILLMANAIKIEICQPCDTNIKENIVEQIFTPLFSCPGL